MRGDGYFIVAAVMTQITQVLKEWRSGENGGPEFHDYCSKKKFIIIRDNRRFGTPIISHSSI